MDEMNKIINWIADNMQELDFRVQLKITEAYMEMVDEIRPIYDKYNSPRTFLFKYGD